MKFRYPHNKSILRLCAASLSLASLLGACSGEIGGDGVTMPPDDDEPGSSAGRGPGPAPGGTGGTGGPSPSVCSGDQATLGKPLVGRLSARQYQRAVKALLTGRTVPDVSGMSEAYVDGFANFAGQGTTLEDITLLESSARLLTDKMQATSVASCSGSNAAAQKKCGHDFITDFGRKAFRRPLTADEANRWKGFFDESMGAHGYEDAVRMVVEAFVQAPQFLYVTEVGEPVSGDDKVRRLTQNELATRLALVLTDAPPDAQLISAAEAGALDDPSKLTEQVQRLLDSANGRESVANFHSQWLHLDTFQDLAREPEGIEYSDALEQGLRDGLTRFVSHVFWDRGGSVADLLTSRDGFINQTTAPVYEGVSANGSNLSQVQLKADRRAGLLTQAGWLAQHAKVDTDHPVSRGFFVSDRLVCNKPPQPTPDIVARFPEIPDDLAPMTEREFLETFHEEVDGCRGCHLAFDMFGFAFWHYDSVGRWRDTVEVKGVTKELDASGTIVNTADLDGTFDGAVSLSERLANSDSVQRCFVSHWATYLSRRTVEPDAACVIDPVIQEVGGKTGSMSDIVKSIVKSEAFRRFRVD